MGETRIVQKCFTCKGKKMLPLVKDDWLECPDCEGTGEFIMLERVVNPKKIVVVGG